MAFDQYDLEQKIDYEIKMREGTTKLLAACKHEIQSLEPAKSLITSNERMNAYTSELQRRKQAESITIKSSKQLKPCKAKVAISDIRMPLLWKDSDHFKNKGDYRRFSVFCLIKCGTEVYDTVLVNNIDRSATDINFDDIIVLRHIPHDFELNFEVYGRLMHDDLSIASTPKKLKKKISSSVSRTFGRKLGAAIKEELNEPYPKFDLLAKALLRLEDSDESICTYDLELVKESNRQSQLPLFGLFCCRLAVQPYCLTEERLSSYLKGDIETTDENNTITTTTTTPTTTTTTTTTTITTTTSSDKNNKKEDKKKPMYWASLEAFKLCLWRKKLSSVNTEPLANRRAGQPTLIIDINQFTVCRKGSDSKSFTLINTLNFNGKESKVKHTLYVLNKEDREVWLNVIDVHIKEHRVWGKSAETLMEIPEASSSIQMPSFLSQRLPGSLYDQTPLPDKLIKNYSTSSSPNCSTYDLRSKKSSATGSLRSRSSSLSSETDSSSTSTAQLGTNSRWANTFCSGIDLYRTVQLPRITPFY
ncbi:rhotekin-like [Panonychus citri]|uniref:rhotekin-like n=1 Tax=Panonychus citri TaxID=50023 RepID=UPI0023071A30|nr:rhotekin-like [Panonychus citri]